MAIYRQATAPTYDAGGLWFDSDDGDRIYYGAGGVWVPLNAPTGWSDFTDGTPASGDVLVAERGAGSGVGVNLDIDDFLCRDSDGNYVVVNNLLGTGTGFAFTISADPYTSINDGGFLQIYGSTAGKKVALGANGVTQVQVDSDGTKILHNLIFSGAYASTYHMDTTPALLSMAPSATLDIPNFSGMLVVTNNTTGGTAVWICGGGLVVNLGYTANMNMTVAYNAGVVGYRLTHVGGSTASFGVAIIRTRTTG